MTIGEIMFSISGISFAYSQAPATMKSVLQAMWYNLDFNWNFRTLRYLIVGIQRCMTVAFGNLIVVIVAESRFVKNQVNEYFLFAGLLGFATITFAVLSFFYKYNDSISDELAEEEKSSQAKATLTKEDNEGVMNVAYSKASLDADIKLIKMKSLDPN